MIILSKLPAFIGSIASVTLVYSHPIWNFFNSRSSVDSLVTSSTFLLAGGVKFGVPYYLTTPWPPGSAGNLTVSFLSNQDDAPIFFVHNRQLFHHTNESQTLYVNVLNATGSMDEPLPYKLALADERDGLIDAMWRWRGAFLHIGHGQMSNNGLYYQCLSINGNDGVYTSFDLISTPEGCKVVTLHNFDMAISWPKQRLLSA